MIHNSSSTGSSSSNSPLASYRGTNTIEFDVWNGIDQYAPEAANPVALRVEWQAFGRPLDKQSPAPVAATTAVDW